MKSTKRNFKLLFDRSFSSGLGKQIIWLFAIMLAVYLVLVILSSFKLLYSPGSEGSHGRWYDILLVLIDPGSGSEAMSSPFIIICAVLGLIIFSGMLISVISNVLERRVESYIKGETDYPVSNHVVIIGFNRSVPSLLTVIHKKHQDSHIVLMSEQESVIIRDWVHAHVESVIEDLLIVINGTRKAEDDLARLHLDNNVKEIYVLGEEEELAHDALNLECVKYISKLLPENAKNKVECHVQIDSQTTYSVLQQTDFSKTNTEGGITIGNRIKFLPFNFNEIWSQKALATIPNGFRPLDGKGITSGCNKHVHLIIIGMNDMGTTLAVNSAHILHFPNFKEGDFTTYSHITFIDSEAISRGKSFRNRYHHLFSLARWREMESGSNLNDREWNDPMSDHSSPYHHLGEINFLDIQWEFIQGNVFDDEIYDYIMKCSTYDGEITTIAFCDEDSEHNISSLLALPEAIFTKANTILVRQKETPITIEQIRQLPNHDKVSPFGMMSECYAETLISDKYGKIINACYNGIDPDKLLLPNGEGTTEEIEKIWDGCSITDKWSSNYCANMLFSKLRSLGLDTDEKLTKEALEVAVNQRQDEIQRTEHNRWNTEKLLLSFAPLTKEEQDEFPYLREDWDAVKKKRKDWSKRLKKHLDICSNDRLKIIDKPMTKFDNDVNSKLWTLYQLTQQ